MFIDGAIDQFLNSLILNGNSHNTARAYGADLREFQKWHQATYPLLNPPDWTQLPHLAQMYVTEGRKTWQPTTTKRKVSAIRAYGRFCGTPLLEGYRVPKPPKPIPHPIPEGINGILEMIQECKTDQQKVLIAQCGLGGLRVSEARAVRFIDVIHESKTLYVHGKGDAFRFVPMSALLQGFVGLVCSPYGAIRDPSQPLVGQMADRTARAMITRMGAKAALSRPVKSHDLRATFATAAYAKCKNLRVVQELLGHVDSGTTEVYTGISMDSMREAVEVL